MAVKVAIIGSGFGSSTQVPGFRAVPGVEVVALASGRLERARQAAARLNIPHAFDDYQTLLDAVDVDLVSIAAPPYLHHEMVLASVQRGKHVICEKPFALDLAQAEDMLGAAERAGVVHAVDHEFRFLPARAGFKTAIEDGALGEPRLVRIVWRSDARAKASSPAHDWWSQREKGGGALGAIGSHYLDSLRWWFGEVQVVSALLNAFVPRRPLPNGQGEAEVTSDDSATVSLRLEAGAQATLSVTMAAGPRGSRVEAHGSDGALMIEDDERLFSAKPGASWEPLPLPEERFRRAPDDPRLVSPFAELVSRVVARIEGGGEATYPTFHEGVAVQRALDAAYAAAYRQ